MSLRKLFRRIAQVLLGFEEPDKAGKPHLRRDTGLDGAETHDPTQVHYTKGIRTEAERREANVQKLKKIKEQHPRAYSQWSKPEEARLISLLQKGLEPVAIANILERQPSAIRNRIRKLEARGELRLEPLEAKPHLHEEGRTKNVRLGTPLKKITPQDQQTIEFFTLAVSSMKGEAICVAGIDVENGRWIRLVLSGRYSMFQSELGWFPENTILSVRSGGHSPRPPDLDPFALHSEDRTILNKPKGIRDVGVGEKRQLLERALDSDLSKAIGSPGRSLFMAKPEEFRSIPRPEKSPKIWFDTGSTNTDALRGSERLQQRGIGISSVGCPCTCLRWPMFLQKMCGGSAYITERDLRRLCADAEVYFALSLTGWPTTLPPDKQKHYLLVAGVHVVGDRIWL